MKFTFFERQPFTISYTRYFPAERRVLVYLSLVNVTIHWLLHDAPVRPFSTGARLYGVHWCENKFVFTFGIDPYVMYDAITPWWRQFVIRLWRNR